MVHFDFILDDADAENLMWLFSMAVSNNLEQITEEMVAEEPNEIVMDALRADIRYLNTLQLKMTNSRVTKIKMLWIRFKIWMVEGGPRSPGLGGKK